MVGPSAQNMRRFQNGAQNQKEGLHRKKRKRRVCLRHSGFLALLHPHFWKER